MRALKICVLFFLFSLLFSCNKEDIDYEIINDFIKTNKIEISNLQSVPFCFKELYLNKQEENVLKLKTGEDVLCNEKFDLQKIQKKKNDNLRAKCKISHPIYSEDKLHIYIVVSNYYSNKVNFYEEVIFYKLIKTDGHWEIADSYKSVTQT